MKQSKKKTVKVVAAVVILTALSLLFSACGATSQRTEELQPSISGNFDTGSSEAGVLDAAEYPGQFCSQMTITDPASGIPLVDTILPVGWTYDVACNWNNLSGSYPGVAQISLFSPDYRAGIVYYTAQSFLESYDLSGLQQHYDHLDYENYVTCLYFMNASQMLDYFYQNYLGAQNFVESELPCDENLRIEATELAGSYAENQWSYLQSLFAGSGAYVEPQGYEGSVILRRDSLQMQDGSTYLAEGFCATIGMQHVIYSYGVGIVQKPWICPLIIVFYAEDEAAMEAYRSDYELFSSNTRVRNEFHHLNSRYGQYIQNTIVKQRTAAQQSIAMSQEQAQSLMTDFDSNAYSSDDWGNDWSDYIYDRNEYYTSEGDSIKVSTAYDTVYRNGNEYYFGPQGSAPFGWEELYRN